jgi:hypothetical protein
LCFPCECDAKQNSTLYLNKSMMRNLSACLIRTSFPRAICFFDSFPDVLALQEERSFPLRPKSFGYEAGVRIQIEDGDSFWQSQLPQYNWTLVQRDPPLAVLEYSQTGAVRDVVYLQVITWQQWSATQSDTFPQLRLTGVFDAETQLALDRSPVAPMWPLNFCEAATAAPSGRAATDATPVPTVPMAQIDDQGSLAIVIAAPTGVLTVLLAAIVAFALLRNGAGPRVPLGETKRGHADPWWINQRHSDDWHDMPDFDDKDNRLDSWEEFDLRDPEPWSEAPSQWDTTELESELDKMRADPRRKKAKKRVAPGRDARVAPSAASGDDNVGEDVVVQEELSEEAVVVIDAKMPPPAANQSAAPQPSLRPSAAEPSDYDDGEDEDEYEDSDTATSRN